MQRVEGQIWIDKNLPNKLKYHTGGKDYVVETSSSYPTSLDATGLKVGQTVLPAGLLVKLDKTAGVARASFPDDLENVLGVLTTDIKLQASGNTSSAIVSRSGYLTIDEPWQVFKEFEALNSTSLDNDYQNKLPSSYTTMIGKPVYWYIGSTTEKAYTSPATNEAGKLTFSTPTKFEWIDDAGTGKTSLNVAYDNLPQVGTFVGIEEGKIYLHLNFSKFDSTIEWTWPGVHEGNNSKCGFIETTQTKNAQDGSKEIFIRHGLFADSDNKHNVRSFCDIVALKEHESENKEEETIKEEYLVQAPVINKTTGSDRYTKIIISSPETLYYRVSGRISYKFDRGGNN